MNLKNIPRLSLIAFIMGLLVMYVGFEPLQRTASERKSCSLAMTANITGVEFGVLPNYFNSSPYKKISYQYAIDGVSYNDVTPYYGYEFSPEKNVGNIEILVNEKDRFTSVIKDAYHDYLNAAAIFAIGLLLIVGAINHYIQTRPDLD